MSQFIPGNMTKRWFSKLWITFFWKEILHLNFKDIVEKMMCQTFNEMQAKSSFGRNVGGQEFALHNGGQSKSYYFVEKSKSHEISPLNAFPLKFRV